MYFLLGCNVLSKVIISIEVCFSFFIFGVSVSRLFFVGFLGRLFIFRWIKLLLILLLIDEIGNIILFFINN